MLKKVEKLTEAEEAMLDASSALKNNVVRASAANILQTHGLPTRRIEAWHYTDLRNRLKQFDGVAAPATETQVTDWFKGVSPFVDAICLPFLNGRYLADIAGSLPEGVKLDIGAAAAGFRDATDAIALTNSMLAEDGVRLSVARGVSVSSPVELLHHAVSQGASASRHAVEVGAGAAATFVERHSSVEGSRAFSNTVTGLTLGDGANAMWIVVQEEADDASHLAQLNITLRKDSRLAILLLNAGGSLVRREINVAVRGAGSQLSIRGVNLIGGQSHVDVTTSLVHEAPETVSNEIFRNVATGSGSGVFQGEIRVAKPAQKTDAKMACNTLLLSDEAEFSAKPELEIFADDVQCGHGATVTDILDTHLFYLRSRGISERDARALLVKAFVEEVFDDVENEALRDGLNARIENWLNQHG